MTESKNSNVFGLTESQVEALDNAGWCYGIHDDVFYAFSDEKGCIYGDFTKSFLESEAEALLTEYTDEPSISTILNEFGYKIHQHEPLVLIENKSQHMVVGTGALFVLKEAIKLY